MGQVYSQVPTYSDRGEVVLRYRQGGQQFESRFPMSVVFQRPNKILLRSYEGMVYCDGEKLYGVHEDVPGYVVTRPAPPQLEPDDLYFDPYLKFMLTNREAGQSFQVRLLLVQGFIERMLDQLAQELKLLEPQKVDGETCHVVLVRVPDGELRFYVGHNTAVLRRLDYPVEQLAKQIAQGGPPVEELSLVAQFRQAQLGAPLDPDLLARPFPKNWKEVRRFIGPAPPQVLGKKISQLNLRGLDGKRYDAQSLQGKVVLLDFWATWCQPCLQSMPTLAQVYKHFKDRKEVLILAVSTDDPSVKDEEVLGVLKRLGVEVPVARPQNMQLLAQLGVQAIPCQFLLDKRGVVQWTQLGFDPTGHAAQELIKTIEEVLQGRNLWQERIAAFEAQMMELPQGESAPASGTSTAPAGASPPKRMQLKLRWELPGEQTQWGNMIVVHAEQEPQLWVIANWQRVVALDAQGNTFAREDLPLEQGEVVTYLHSAIDAEGKRYFVLGAVAQKRVHVFDQQWNLVCHYPQVKDHPGVLDAKLSDLNGDGKLELLVSYLDVVGVHGANLEGKRLWSNRGFDHPFWLQPTPPGKNKQRKLLVCHSQGTVAILDHQGQTEDELRIGQLLFHHVLAEDLDGDGQVEYAGLALSGQGNRDVLVGFTLSGKMLWSYELPPGTPHPSLVPILAARLLGPKRHWIAVGPDASVHLVSAQGKLLDRFNYGQPIQGIAVLPDKPYPLLVIASPSGLRAYEVVPRLEQSKDDSPTRETEPSNADAAKSS